MDYRKKVIEVLKKRIAYYKDFIENNPNDPLLLTYQNELESLLLKKFKILFMSSSDCKKYICKYCKQVTNLNYVTDCGCEGWKDEY